MDYQQTEYKYKGGSPAYSDLTGIDPALLAHIMNWVYDVRWVGQYENELRIDGMPVNMPELRMEFPGIDAEAIWPVAIRIAANNTRNKEKQKII
jgi:hypothetical protein